MTMIASIFSRHLKNTVKAPFVGKNSKKFPDGIEVIWHFILGILSLGILPVALFCKASIHYASFPSAKHFFVRLPFLGRPSVNHTFVRRPKN